MAADENQPGKRPRRCVFGRVIASLKRAMDYRRRSAADIVDEAERARRHSEATTLSALDLRNSQQL